MQTRWVNATFWGPDPRLHPGIVYSQYARDVDVEPGAASKIRNPKISKSWRKFPRKSLRCPWVPGTLHPIAMLQLHPNHCKAQAVQPSENIPSIRYVRTCATTTTWRQRTATSKSLFSWGHRLGGMWSRRLRRRRLLFLPSPWSNEIPWETQFSEEETNPSFEIFFFTQTQLISVKCWFVQILRSKPKADLMSVDCRIHSPSRIRTSWIFWSPFCYVMTGVEWLSFKLDATLRPLVFSAPKGPHQPNHCPRRTSTSCTPAINIHIIHMHIQKSSKNSQANQQQSQYRRTYTCLYAYILQYMLCQTVKWISMWCQTSKESH